MIGRTAYYFEHQGSPLNGAQMVLRERRRQTEKERYSTDHDDEHTRGELARAAACYETVGDMLASRHNAGFARTVPRPKGHQWPWSWSDWKPATDAVRNYEKAGALFIAESERLLRAFLIHSRGTSQEAAQMVANAQRCSSKIDAVRKA